MMLVTMAKNPKTDMETPSTQKVQLWIVLNFSWVSSPQWLEFRKKSSKVPLVMFRFSRASKSSIFQIRAQGSVVEKGLRRRPPDSRISKMRNKHLSFFSAFARWKTGSRKQPGLFLAIFYRSALSAISLKNKWKCHFLEEAIG